MLNTWPMMRLNGSRYSVGVRGENWAKNVLVRSGYHVERASVYCGDLRVVNPADGLVVYVEVKTSRRGLDNRYRCTLRKAGHTAITAAVSFCLFLAVLPSGLVCPFLIPAAELAGRSALTISSCPFEYGGRWSSYRAALPLSLGVLQ